MAEPKKLCDDGGVCHHDCPITTPSSCFRRKHATPLSATGCETWEEFDKYARRCPPDGFCGGEGTADCEIHGEYAAEVAFEEWKAKASFDHSTFEHAFHCGWEAARDLPPRWTKEKSEALRRYVTEPAPLNLYGPRTPIEQPPEKEERAL